MDFRIAKWFVYFAGAVFLTGAAGRFAILAQNTHLSRLLLNKAQDPLLGFNVRHEVWTVGLAESFLAVICLWNFKLPYRVAVIAWAATNYFVFRAALYSQQLKLQTSCLGTLSDPWQIANGIPGRCLGVIPYILLVGSYGLLLWQWHQSFRQQRREKATQQDLQAGLLKMSCPACGGHIKFAAANVGQKISCPHCRAPVALRRAEERLKTSCFFCQGHIEFPAHALGSKMPCPHCQMDITLKEPA